MGEGFIEKLEGSIVANFEGIALEEIAERLQTPVDGGTVTRVRHTLIPYIIHEHLPVEYPLSDERPPVIALDIYKVTVDGECGILPPIALELHRCLGGPAQQRYTQDGEHLIEADFAAHIGLEPLRRMFTYRSGDERLYIPPYLLNEEGRAIFRAEGPFERLSTEGKGVLAARGTHLLSDLGKVVVSVGYDVVEIARFLFPGNPDYDFFKV